MGKRRSKSETWWISWIQTGCLEYVVLVIKVVVVHNLSEPACHMESFLVSNNTLALLKNTPWSLTACSWKVTGGPNREIQTRRIRPSLLLFGELRSHHVMFSLKVAWIQITWTSEHPINVSINSSTWLEIVQVCTLAEHVWSHVVLTFVTWETSAQANWAVTKTPGCFVSIGEDATHLYDRLFPESLQDLLSK